MTLNKIKPNILAILPAVLVFLISIFLVDSYNDDFYGKTVWNFSVFPKLPDFISWKLSLAISLFLIPVAAILLYGIDSAYFATKSKSYQIATLWIIQVAGFPFLHPLTEMHVAVVFILLSYGKLFSIGNKSDELSDVFISTMYLGIATIFYAYVAYLLIPHIIAIYRFRYATFRDWAIAFAGFLTPFYFSIFISFFISGDCLLYPIKATASNLVPHFFSDPLDLSVAQYLMCAYILLLTAVKNFVAAKSSFSGMNQKIISCNMIFSTMLLFSASIFIFFGENGKYMLSIIFIYTASGLKILSGFIRKKIIRFLIFTVLTVLSLAAFLYES